jgi:hypothetical protein
MLNENVYTRLQKQSTPAAKLTSEREKIRNEYIDKMGEKPSEQKIDELLVKSKLSF